VAGGEQVAKKRKNVLLALGWYDHRLIQGIGAYAAEHHWHLSSASVTQEFVIPYSWRGDGILAWLAGEDELASFVLGHRIPVVDFSLRRKHPRPRVVFDHDMTGRLAAQHFLDRGFRNFLYYSFSDNWTYQERGASFVAELEKNGLECKWLKGHAVEASRRDRSFWSARQRWLEREILAAPKPVAIFTANGAHALEVMEVCESAGIRIPDEVAIIGWEDDLLVGQANLRSITTVDPNYEELGYRGASLLDKLMAGEKPPPKPIRVDSARIITRHSSEVTSVPHAGVQRAVQFILEHLADPIGVDDVAEVAGMSRRGLHQAFIDQMGRTPGGHIRATRIDRARKLLAETDIKVEVVAKRSGYPSLNTFFVAFKKACGKTPAEYRREARRARWGGVRGE
jgi:LacI family transcriptional regulator